MNTITASAPGRINIIGEHTDYNDGFVLPAAIDKKTTIHLTLNGSPSACKIIAENLRETYEFDLKNYQPIKRGWPNYVMGVVNELEKLGAEFQGFEARFSSDVPIGSGMSSSAALECSFAFAFNELFDLGLGKWDLIKAAQMSEHNFVGIQCGIMDQFASMMGKKNQAMLLDCRSLEYQYIPIDLGAYELLLLNTNVTHSLADSAYNDRKAQCEEGVRFFQKHFPKNNIKNLRDVDLEMLMHSQSQLPELIFKRCDHVIKENHRVLSAEVALKNGQLKGLGELLYKSHDSLKNNYEVSCPELDFLVEDTMQYPEVLGSRMMGGGFGGCTLNVIRTDFIENFISNISKKYQSEFGLTLTPYQVSIENGASMHRT